jgi:uncharacterized protein YecA (UPF0149 family)
MNYDPNPKPLEETDKSLAMHMQLIAEGRHPIIKGIGVEKDRIVTVMRDGTVKIKRVPLPGRNEPCSCGSGKKHKKCCGR